MAPIEISAPTTKEINQEILIRALGGKLEATEADLKSLKDAVRVKNEKIVKLEAENIRLKLERTDKELSAQVDGLRTEVSKKDRELVDLKRAVGTLKENEVLLLRRASAAEQKILLQQTTMERMQKSRDAAHAEVEAHEKDRLDAVRKVIDYDDRLKKANVRIAELEGKGKPVARNSGSEFRRK
jgi:chromosome segregation ATPase